MQSGAPNYFISVSLYGPGVPSLTFVLGPMWAEIQRVPRPNASYTRPRVPVSARIAPTALPAHIPHRLPPRVVIYRDFLYKAVAAMAALSASFLPLVLVLAVTAGAGSPPTGPPPGLVGFGAFALITALAFGVWLFALELIHQGTVKKANAERDAILEEYERERDKRVSAHRHALDELNKAEGEWRRIAASYLRSFDANQQSLEALKKDYLDLKQRYDQELGELERKKETMQLAQFLQTQFISDHDIPGIGPGLEAILRSNNIETAYDVEARRIEAISGFGHVRTARLVAWRQQTMKSFRFNAAAAVPPNELAALAVKYKQIQQRLEAGLQSGLAELRTCYNGAARDQGRLYTQVPALVMRLEQAKTDLEVLCLEES
jgi:hypothetical protein